MRLQKCHNGHRVTLPHWNPYQFLDIKLVGHTVIVAVDENRQEIIFERDDMNREWIHLGATPNGSSQARGGW